MFNCHVLITKNAKLTKIAKRLFGQRFAVPSSNFVIFVVLAIFVASSDVVSVNAARLTRYL